MHRKSLFLLVLIIFFTNACSRKIAPPPAPPVAQESPTEFFPPKDSAKPIILPELTATNSISEIRLPISMDTAALKRQVNALVPDTLYNDNDITDDKMIIIARKIDQVDLTLLPNRFEYNVPFNLYIERDVTLTHIKAEGSLRLYFNTDYTIQPNWLFSCKTTVVKHEWIEKPKVKLGLINLPIETIADKILERSADMVCKNIDYQLQTGFKLREYIDQAWHAIQDPIQITDTPKVTWLLLKPEKIAMVPFNTANGKVQTSLLFRSGTDIAFGERPVLPYAGVLPTFEEVSDLGKDSTIELSINFPLKRAEILMQEYFKGQEFKDGSKIARIDSLQLSGDGNRLHANAFISGTYPMMVEFEGIPVYNKLKRQFELKDMDYSVKSRNILVKAASWLLNKKIEKRLTDLLIYEVGKYMDQGRKNLDDALSQSKAQGFKMQADIQDIWALDPVINGPNAEIKFLANGKFRILIDELVK